MAISIGKIWENNHNISDSGGMLSILYFQTTPIGCHLMPSAKMFLFFPFCNPELRKLGPKTWKKSAICTPVDLAIGVNISLKHHCDSSWVLSTNRSKLELDHPIILGERTIVNSFFFAVKSGNMGYRGTQSHSLKMLSATLTFAQAHDCDRTEQYVDWGNNINFIFTRDQHSPPHLNNTLIGIITPTLSSWGIKIRKAGHQLRANVQVAAKMFKASFSQSQQHSVAIFWQTPTHIIVKNLMFPIIQ